MKGPWSIEVDAGVHQINDANGEWVCECINADAARLIAAAPDLLAALQQQLEAHYTTWMAARAEVEGAAKSHALFEKEPDVISARAAIAKATAA